MEYKYTAIILNKKNIGETDRLYVLYTLEGGKISSIAKGVRKPQAKLAASLENITLADVCVIRSRGLGKITSSIVENNFTLLKGDCGALLDVFLGLSVFEKLIDFENPDQLVFLLLKDYLEAMDFYVAGNLLNIDDDNLNIKYSLIRLGFLVKLLDLLGFAIEVENCVSCGNKLSQDLIYFGSKQGGALCQNCIMGHENIVLRINANVVKIIRLFLKNKLSTVPKISVKQVDCDQVQLVVDDFLRWII
ncbi:MAG: DNA repair protein RecO [bacterium]